MNLNSLRTDFPVLNQKINNRGIVYLDSAASSLKPDSVIQAINRYYSQYGVNIFRGVYSLSEKATRDYEKARTLIADFIGSSDSREIIFTRNATEAINLVAESWGSLNLYKGDNVVSTVMEHHANIVPWQQITAKKKADLRFIDITGEGFLNLSGLEKIIDKKTKIAVFTYVSNVLGTINPVTDIISKIKHINPRTLILIDTAQAVPHMSVNVSGLGADFIVFSGHKMLGPTGIGVLWSRFSLLDNMPPYQTGGDMIREVYLDHTVFNDLPHKFEAGTPNIAGAIGLGAAVSYLQSTGMDKIRKHEQDLTAYALSRLSGIKNFKFYGPSDAGERGGVIAFNIKGIHPHDLSTLLDQDNVCIRSGHHCAMPLHRKLNIPASCRASFYIYNSLRDIDKLVEGILKAKKVFGI